MKTIVIGGGPAGMLASISAKRSGYDVTLIEKNNILGKKLSITGKGRCNITSNLRTMQEFIDHIPRNGRFLYSAFERFNNRDIIELLGIPTKVERGERIFPVSDKAIDVVNALERNLDGIEIIKNTRVKKIITMNNHVHCVETDTRKYYADKVILATGGMSYQGTGSTGDGYKIAKMLGHTIVELRPSLVGLVADKRDAMMCKELQGLSLKNVKITVCENNKKVYEELGEMVFTDNGVSGPVILSASAHLVRTKMREAKVNIDLKPALSQEKLDNRILRDFEKYKNKDLRNALTDLLPRKIIPVVIRMSEISPYKKVNEITKQERRKIVDILKNMEINIVGFRPINEAIVTRGGVSVKEINPKTLESKIIKGLYFAGEIIDVDGYTGGFNLQIAYSTGYTAGLCL